MAGTVTTTKTVNKINADYSGEIIIDMACVSDSATGLVPDTSLTGLNEYVLTRIKPVPDGSVPFTAAYEVRIEDADGAPAFLSGSIATTGENPILGVDPAGGYPIMDSTMTLKFVDPADHTSTINVGNSKELVLRLRFEKR